MLILQFTVRPSGKPSEIGKIPYLVDLRGVYTTGSFFDPFFPQAASRFFKDTVGIKALFQKRLPFWL